MADSMSMAHLAFGDPGRSMRAGRALAGLRTVSRLAGARGRSGGRRKKSRKHRGRPGGSRSRGIRFTNDFVKTVLLMAMVKGLQHA